jgi:hypothetical protein
MVDITPADKERSRMEHKQQERTAVSTQVQPDAALHTSEKGASPAWFGGLAVGFAVLAFGWWLLWVWGVAFGALGNWNYLIFIGTILGAAITMRFWRGA